MFPSRFREFSYTYDFAEKSAIQDVVLYTLSYAANSARTSTTRVEGTTGTRLSTSYEMSLPTQSHYCCKPLPSTHRQMTRLIRGVI